jgi:hypothetical protein
MKSTPRALAVRLMVWQYCQPRGWDVTFNDIVFAVDATPGEVSSALRRTGWHKRLPAPKVYRHHHRASSASQQDVDRLIDDIQRGLT